MSNLKKVNKESLVNMSKESKIVLFLIESKNKNKVEIEKLYLEKYNLNEKSNRINLRVLDRFFGVYSKYSKEKKELRVKELKENLSKVNINYLELVNNFKEIKSKVKRSNRINNFLEIKI